MRTFSKFTFNIDHSLGNYKFLQLVDQVNEAVNHNELTTGDILPSVNQVCDDCKLSRDTVFKAYAELKKQGIIESIPNRGYFVARTNPKVLLFLDTIKAYKEVLYASFIENLPKNFSVDVHFHHYNIDVFEQIIKSSLGKCSKFVIMNFDHPRVSRIIQQIQADKLLLIDWDIHGKPEHSFVRQDFGQPVYDALLKHLDIIRKYERLIYLYPEFTYHPEISKKYFRKFLGDYQLKGFILDDYKQFNVKRGDLYLLVSDRTLACFLDQCEEKRLQLGVDVGVISYNETPMKKYVKNGITVLSTDFVMLGKMAAAFVLQGQPLKHTVPTNLILRNST